MSDGAIFLVAIIIVGIIVMVATYHVIGLLAMSGKHDNRGEE